MQYNLSDVNVIRRILQAHGFHFSKSLGQNFLIDPDVCPRMAQASIHSEDDAVLEIGPGFGVLTQELAKLAGKVVAIELDKRLPDVLAETLEDFDNVKVVQGDVLKMDLCRLMQEEFPGQRVIICANLPYYITSPVIMKILEEKLPVSLLTVMVQKEAAQRLCALPGQRECGAVSAAVQLYAQPEILFEVPRESFYPAPNVDSAVMQLKIRDQAPEWMHDLDDSSFFRTVHAAFLQRRKTLLNSLSSGLHYGKDKIRQAITEAGISEQARAEQLSVEQLADLARALERIQE